MKRNTDTGSGDTHHTGNGATGHGKSQEPAKPALRVLVIEDNEDDEALLTRQLSKAGMAAHVKFLRDGQDAWEFLTAHPKDLASTLMVIFLDLKLPRLTGLELLRQLRQNTTLGRIPVVVMTSSNDPADLDECNALKVDNYIEKPVTFSSFSKAMADVFHAQSTRHAPAPLEVGPAEYS